MRTLNVHLDFAKGIVSSPVANMALKFDLESGLAALMKGAVKDSIYDHARIRVVGLEGMDRWKYEIQFYRNSGRGQSSDWLRTTSGSFPSPVNDPSTFVFGVDSDNLPPKEFVVEYH